MVAIATKWNADVPDPRIPQSALPDRVVERTVSPYRRTEYDNGGSGEWLRVAECVVDGIVVARREYDAEDRLIHEIPVDAEGRRHGVVLEWHESGHLSLAEPYEAGLIHGTALQWDANGQFLGQYTLDRGTGFDIWRCREEDGTISVSEVQSLRNGVRHGFQWWFTDDQRLWWERHFVNGSAHGIDREWNENGTLRRDAPRYWISDEKVDKRRYLRAAANDPTLPPFDAESQRPIREFPSEVQGALEASRSC